MQPWSERVMAYGTTPHDRGMAGFRAESGRAPAPRRDGPESLVSAIVSPFPLVGVLIVALAVSAGGGDL